MDKIGIIGAMDEEIATYLQHLKKTKTKEYYSFTFYEGTLNNQSVVIVKSGVGKVFAAMITQYLIDTFKVKTILFTGVAGALNKNIQIGDLVIGKDSMYHDFDATALGFQRGKISYTNLRIFPANKELLKSALNTKLDKNNFFSGRIITGRILTGDQFFTQSQRNKHNYFTAELHGDCIEMEGAAVAHVCTINNIPHLIIRTISDQADGKAVQDYNRFKSVVAQNSFAIINKLISEV